MLITTHLKNDIVHNLCVDKKCDTKKIVMAAICIMHKRDHGNYTSKSDIAHFFLSKSKK